MENYQELTEIKEDPRFGDITIMYHPQDPSNRIMKKIKKSQTPEQYEKSKKEVLTRKKISHPNILKLLSHSFLPSEKKTIVFFDYPDDIIEISNLSPKEAIRLFRDILEAITYLQSKKMVHGDLRPEYIVFDKKENLYVLLDRLMDVSLPLQSQLNNINNYKSLYMAPKIFDELMKKTKKIRQNSYKSELFSLGMIVLGVFLEGNDIQSFYSFEKNCFDVEFFEGKIGDLMKRNYDEWVLTFLTFLKEFVVAVREEGRLKPRKALSKLMKIKELFKVWPENEFDEEDELEINLRLDTTESEDRLDSITTTKTGTTVNYYNPFDFVNPKIDFKRKDSLDIANNKDKDLEVNKVKDNQWFVVTSENQLLDDKKMDFKKPNVNKIDLEVINNESKITSEVITNLNSNKNSNSKNNLPVLVKKPELLNNVVNIKKKPSIDNTLEVLRREELIKKIILSKKDLSDKLVPLKYFRLKLDSFFVSKPNFLSKFKNERVSTKIVQKIEEIKKEKEDLWDGKDFIQSSIIEPEIKEKIINNKKETTIEKMEFENILKKRSEISINTSSINSINQNSKEQNSGSLSKFLKDSENKIKNNSNPPSKDNLKNLLSKNNINSSLENITKNALTKKIPNNLTSPENCLKNSSLQNDNKNDDTNVVKNESFLKEENFDNLIESMGMVYNPEEEDNNETLEQIISRKLKEENLIYSHTFFDGKKDFSEKKQNLSYSGNLKDFLRKKSMTERKINSTSIFSKNPNEKKVERKISESFNFLKPKKKKNRTPLKRTKSKKSIAKNFIMMNIKPNQISKIKKKKISKSPSVKKLIFNSKKKLSQSPINKKPKILQRSKSNIFIINKKEKTEEKKNRKSKRMSQYEKNILENIKRPLPLKSEKLQKNQKKIQFHLNPKPSEELSPNRPSKMAKDFAFNIILNNIEMRIKYQELKKKQDLINFEYNNTISETSSFLQNQKTYQNPASLTNDVYSRKSQESNITEKTEYLKKKQNVYSNYKKKQLKMSFDQKIDKNLLPSKTLGNLLKKNNTKTRETSPNLNFEETETYKKFEKAKRIMDNNMNDKYSFDSGFKTKNLKNGEFENLRNFKNDNGFFLAKNREETSGKNDFLIRNLLEKNKLESNLDLRSRIKKSNLDQSQRIYKREILKKGDKNNYPQSYRSITPYNKKEIYKKFNYVSNFEKDSFDKNIYQNIKNREKNQNNSIISKNRKNESEDDFVRDLQPKLISEKTINLKDERNSNFTNEKNIHLKDEKKEFWSSINKADNSLSNKRVSQNSQRISKSNYNYKDRVFVREENGRKIYRLNLK